MQPVQFEKLAELINITKTSQPLEKSLHDMLLCTASLFNADAASLILTGKDSYSLYFKDAVGPKGDLVKKYTLQQGEGLAGLCIQNNEIIIVNDAAADSRMQTDIAREIGYPVQTVLCVPLVMEGTVRGALEILNKQPSGAVFSQVDRGLAEIVAAHMAQIIDIIRVTEERESYIKRLEETRAELDQRIHTLEKLYDIEKEIKHAVTVKAALQSITRTALDLLRADAGSILLENEERDTLTFLTVSGEKENRLQSLKLKSSQGIVGWVYRNGKPILTNSPYEDSRFNKKIDKLIHFKTRNLICVPIFFQQKTVGAFEVLNRQDNGPFTEHDQQLLTLIANRAGSILAHLLYEREQEKNERLISIGKVTNYILHDLNNNLTPIIGVPHLLEIVKTDEDGRQVIALAKEIINNKKEDIMHLINELLLFSKGKQGLDKNTINIQSFVQDIYRELQVRTQEHYDSLTVNLECEDSCNRNFNADGLKLKRVFINLYTNAAYELAKQKDGEITLRAYMDGTTVVFQLEDNGPGIPEEYLETIFEPFFSTKKSKGTGLGLTIIANIVQLHEGTVSVSSSPKGTIFTIKIPL